MGHDILYKKFEVLKCFKKDEYSAVYLANHIFLDKKVFVKILHTNLIPDPTIVERFKREAKILASLEHPNIIKVYDFGMFEDQFYISFEYFESKNLRELLNQQKISESAARTILVQITKGLNFAHKMSVIHRDIKPENILINDNFEVKLTDFGLAHSQLDYVQTQKYSVVGTPAYMSPEQIFGDNLTNRSDLFSLGIVLLELFGVKNPFWGKNTNDTINKISSFNIKMIKPSIEQFPQDIQNILIGLLKPNPADRFDSCKKILELLNISDNERNIKESKKGFNVILVVLTTSFIIVLLYFNYWDDNLPGNESDINSEVIKSIKDSLIKESDEKTVDSSDIMNFSEENPQINVSEKSSQLAESEVESPNIIATHEFGELNVKCFPWGSVFLNDSLVDTTPLAKNLTVETGIYSLRIVHPEYPEFTDSIEIKKNDITYVNINLETLFGYLECKVFPWGEVFIDNTKMGITPLDNAIRLLPGNYILSIQNPQFSDYSTEINISRNDTLRVKLNFKSNNLNVVQ